MTRIGTPERPTPSAVTLCSEWLTEHCNAPGSSESFAGSMVDQE
jgi:hypothetical protein